MNTDDHAIRLQALLRLREELAELHARLEYLKLMVALGARRRERQRE